MSPAALVVLALLAQTAPPVATPEAKAKAQQLLKEGAQLYESGGLAEALEKFNQAYKTYASPKLLFNIGQASRDLGRLAEAMDAFEQFVTEATDAPEDMTAEARKSIDELVPKLGRLRIQCAIVGTEVSVDGKQVGNTPLQQLIWVIPGGHQVTGKHPSASPAVENVEVGAGSVISVNLIMTPKVVPTAAPRRQADLANAQAPNLAEEGRTPPSAPLDRGWLLGRKWTWIAAGGTVLFAAGGTAFGLSMKSRFDSLNSYCGPQSPVENTCTSAEVNQVTFRQNMANAFWGLTAAAAVTTGILFFVEGTPVTVTPLAGQATGMNLRMTY